MKYRVGAIIPMVRSLFTWAFSVSKKRFCVKPSAIAVWVCFLIFAPTVYTALLFLAMALHECGHLTALKLCGVRDVGMTLSGFGAEICYHTAVTGTWCRVMIALGGVILNLLSGVVLLFFWKNFLCLYMAVASFVLAFLNLLPVKGLDGGTALEEILTRYTEPDAVYAVMRCTSMVCVTLLGALSIWVLTVSEFNFSLLLFTLYLSLSVFRL